MRLFSYITIIIILIYMISYPFLIKSLNPRVGFEGFDISISILSFIIAVILFFISLTRFRRGKSLLFISLVFYLISIFPMYIDFMNYLNKFYRFQNQ